MKKCVSRLEKVEKSARCDKRVSERLKGKLYKMVARKRQEAELEVAEIKMLRFSLGVMRMDKIRNEYIRGTAHDVLERKSERPD